MKQHITQDQLNSLSDKERYAIAGWADQKDDLDWPWSSDGIIRKGKLPLFTIGNLIWFLDEHIGSGWWQVQRNGEKTGWRIFSKYGPDFEENEFPELIDALWSAVKKMLEE